MRLSTIALDRSALRSRFSKVAVLPDLVALKSWDADSSNLVCLSCHLTRVTAMQSYAGSIMLVLALVPS